MIVRVRTMSLSRRSSGAQISTASCTGAQISIPHSAARQHASRSISAPLACIGKLRSDRGFGSFVDVDVPTKRRVQRPGQHGLSTAESDHAQNVRYVS